MISENQEERYQLMKTLLDNGRFFKLVCGAGNEDAVEVRRLSTVYTLAGANGLDVSASPEIVKACLKGIEKAYQLAHDLDIEIPVRPFITVSIGMPGDRHVRKASIDLNRCIECGLCPPVCPTEAISNRFVVERSKCIGCGHCESICPPKANAVFFEHNEREIAEILPLCLEAGAENIELHAAVPGDDTIIKEWEMVNKAQPHHFVSMCLDRLHLSDFALTTRIKKAIDISGERFIVQADGVPMSGGKDDFNTTLQAVAIADVIRKNLLTKKSGYGKIHILLSGGTNGKTGELAKLCDIPFSGVSIGTHARKLVQEYINNDRFETDPESVKSAVYIARDLVSRSLEP